MVRGRDGLDRYVSADPVRFAVRGGAIVAQPYELAPSEWGDGSAYVDPIMPLDPPPSELRVELDGKSLALASVADLAILLSERGIRLGEEAVGREQPLAEVFLALTNVGLPYWTYRFSMYAPGEFEACYGLPPDGGRPVIDGHDLMFWARGNPFERQHLRGVHEIRWHLGSLHWQSRQLSTKL
jgi:hypothetical protein